MEEFFDQLIEAVKREGALHPGHIASQETLAALALSAKPEGNAPRPAAAPRTRPASAPRPAASAPPARPAPIPPTAARPDTSGFSSLEELAASIAGCTRCPLAAGRHHIVFGEGNMHPRLLFIGEGPGFDEDRTGRPFVGRAGELLDKMIAAMGFAREEVYIANVVKCRPPNNRAPTPEESAVCGEFLKAQIRLLAPEVMVLLTAEGSPLLGASAARYLLGRGDGITRLRGRWLEYDSIPAMPTFHPAYLLRQESAKREAWSDLKLVMARLGKPIPAPGANSARRNRN